MRWAPVPEAHYEFIQSVLQDALAGWTKQWFVDGVSEAKLVKIGKPRSSHSVYVENEVVLSLQPFFLSCDERAATSLAERSLAIPALRKKNAGLETQLLSLFQRELFESLVIALKNSLLNESKIEPQSSVSSSEDDQPRLGWALYSLKVFNYKIQLVIPYQVISLLIKRAPYKKSPENLESLKSCISGAICAVEVKSRAVEIRLSDLHSVNQGDVIILNTFVHDSLRLSTRTGKALASAWPGRTQQQKSVVLV